MSPSERPKSRQDLALDNQALYRMLQSSTRESTKIQLELEKLKLSLAQSTKQNNALKKLVQAQDEEIRTMKEALQQAKREKLSLLKTLNAGSDSITELERRNSKLKGDLRTTNADRNSVRQDLLDAQRRLKKAKAELSSKTTQFEDAGDTISALRNSLRASRLNNDALKVQNTFLKKKKQDELEEAIGKNPAFQIIDTILETERERYHAAWETKYKSLLQTKSSDLAEMQARLASLQKEQETWRGRMDTMTHKVFAAERRVRMLGHAAQESTKTRDIADASDLPPIKRPTNFVQPANFSTELVDSVTMLNKLILTATTNIIPLFLSSTSTPSWSGNSERAKAVLGEWVAALLLKDGWNKPEILRSIIQIFLVDWCRAIIEAWYPSTQSIAELFLAGLSSDKLPSNEVIKFQAIPFPSTDFSPDIGAWATHILNDLLQIIPAPNMTTEHRDEVLVAITSLAQRAYDIRQALAEHDICGNIQLLIPPSDIPFQLLDSESMTREDKAQSGDRKKPSDLGDVAGCTGIGLQSASIRKSDDGASFVDRTTILSPTIVLARDLILKSEPEDQQKDKSQVISKPKPKKVVRIIISEG